MTQSIFRRVEAAGAGLEADEGVFGVVRMGFGAVPQAGAAVDAFLAVEDGAAVFAGGDGLAGTHLHTNLAVAGFAVVRIEEDDVVGVAGRGLDFATHEQGVLMGD
jgi:hypothetical protein